VKEDHVLGDELAGSKQAKLASDNAHSEVGSHSRLPIFFKSHLVKRGPIQDGRKSKKNRWKNCGHKQDQADQALSGRFVQEESCFGWPGHDSLMYQIHRGQIKLGWVCQREVLLKLLFSKARLLILSLGGARWPVFPCVDASIARWLLHGRQRSGVARRSGLIRIAVQRRAS
jgi:hypothetical protein